MFHSWRVWWIISRVSVVFLRDTCMRFFLISSNYSRLFLHFSICPSVRTRSSLCAVMCTDSSTMCSTSFRSTDFRRKTIRICSTEISLIADRSVSKSSCCSSHWNYCCRIIFTCSEEITKHLTWIKSTDFRSHTQWTHTAIPLFIHSVLDDSCITRLKKKKMRSILIDCLSCVLTFSSSFSFLLFRVNVMRRLILLASNYSVKRSIFCL